MGSNMYRRPVSPQPRQAAPAAQYSMTSGLRSTPVILTVLPRITAK